jgi:glycosyltransferase involved in cell wall biosynthesis
MIEQFDRDLSVVIPTRNRASRLGRFLDALKGQTLAPERFEVVFVDNGSTDGSFEAVQRLAKETPFRTSVLTEPKPGPAAARNRGVEWARGRRILFLGDDILATPPLLAEHLAAAESHPDAAVLGFTAWAPQLTLTPFMRYLAPERGPQFRYATIRDPLDCGFQFFYTSNISLAPHWFELERFDEAFPYACFEDADLGYRFQKRGLKIVFHRPALAWHDHAIRFREFLERVRQMGESTVILYYKYPEMHCDPNMIPSEGYRALDTRGRRLRMALLARLIAVADRCGVGFRERTYERVLEHYFVRAFFSALDRRKAAGR